MTRVVVHVGRLVLTGFRPADGRAIAAALQQELARVLAPPGAASRVASMGAVPRVRVGQVQTGRSAEVPNTPRGVGVAAARGIGQALGVREAAR